MQQYERCFVLLLLFYAFELEKSDFVQNIPLYTQPRAWDNFLEKIIVDDLFLCTFVLGPTTGRTICVHCVPGVKVWVGGQLEK